MAKRSGRVIRITWAESQGEPSPHVDVEAAPLTANLSMIDRRLRKAELTEVQELVDRSDAEWLDRNLVIDAITSAARFFEDNPESLPFSDILDEYFQTLLQKIATELAHERLKLTIV
ncbi:hypothetical protein [Aeoliella sp.]|uniref:hypothetical protein n=1 Tax=Aeoliella sp. TaxID=2795800 RepID=UPI003CCBA465